MNSYVIRLYDSLKKSIKMEGFNIDMLNTYSSDAKKIILKIAVQWACQSQNLSAIEAGRMVISKFESGYLKENLMKTCILYIDLNDGWEARRMLEIFKLFNPSEISSAIELINNSENEEKKDLCLDFLG